MPTEHAPERDVPAVRKMISGTNLNRDEDEDLRDTLNEYLAIEP